MRNNEWSLVPLFVLLCVGQSLQQTYNSRENCDDYHSWNEEETWCKSVADSTFNVNVKSDEDASFSCNGKPLWTDFHAKPNEKITNVKLLKFSRCTMPNMTFHEIAESIGVQPTDRLIIEYTNLGSTLERRHFAGFPTVTHLSMNSDQLTRVPADLLADFPELTILELRDNRLELPLGFFKNLPKLKMLELGNNKLTRIDPLLFEGLNELGTLGIWGNGLTEIEEGTFDALTALFSMQISWNNLITLPEDIFAKLKRLNSTSMSSNSFASLPANLLSRNLELVDFRLKNNHGAMRTLPNRFFADLPKLKEIYLETSNLTELPEDIISGSSAIRNITFRGNSLATLPKNIFNDLINLRTLDLSRNRITDLPDGIFGRLTNLEKLDLQENKLEHISNHLFSRLMNLREINLENNQIRTTDPKSFWDLSNLEVARLSYNQITFKEFEFSNQSPFRNCLNLRDLQLAHNNISYIFEDWNFLLPHLRSLDLKYNQIAALSNADYQFTSGNKLMDLRHNNIGRIDFGFAEHYAKAQPVLTEDKAVKVKILIEDNPIACDGFLFDFLKKLNAQRWMFVNPGHLTCDSPPSMRHIPVSELKYKTSICEYRVCPEGCKEMKNRKKTVPEKFNRLINPTYFIQLCI